MVGGGLSDSGTVGTCSLVLELFVADAGEEEAGVVWTSTVTVAAEVVTTAGLDTILSVVRGAGLGVVVTTGDTRVITALVGWCCVGPALHT